MTNSVNRRLHSISSRWITPTLAPHGFHKRNSIFVRRLEEVFWVIDLQWSRFKSASSGEFTLNCGVFVPGVTSIYFNRAEPTDVKLVDCCIQTRIGMLADDKLDKWWRLQLEDVAEQFDVSVGEEVSSRLEAHVIPFLKRFHSKAEVLSFLVSPRPTKFREVWPQNPTIAYCYAAIIASSLGKSTEAMEYIQEATSTSKGSPIEDVVLRLAGTLRK